MTDFLKQEFTPLAERAVRRDGTIGLKLIEPGWGASGYYSKEVLERDVPKAFPAGTHMYWNHPTLSEQQERPERDLRDLSAVLVSDPHWQESGPSGPGMYADAAVFAGYRETIDDIAEHIGVSIMGSGVTSRGEIEGKSGVVVEEIVTGHSVDFVTKPGAGGKIVSIFEGARGGGRLRRPGDKRPLTEALTNNEIRELLRNKLKERFGDKDTYVYARDWSVEEGWVVFEIDTEDESTNYKLSIEITDDDVLLADEEPTEVRVTTQYIPVATTSESGRPATAADEVSSPNNVGTTEVNDMGDDLKETQAALKKAQEQLSESQKSLAERDGQLARLQEKLILGEASEFVQGKLAESDLPEVTQKRLAQTLIANPPLKEGELDKEKLDEQVEAAVKEARAEIAQLLGHTGQITGQGNGNGQALTAGDAEKRIAESMKAMGYK